MTVPGQSEIGAVPKVVSEDVWTAARMALLAEEKALTQARDRVNAARRRLPMVRIDKPYVFEGPGGQVSLLELFEGRSQLIVHHFMWTYDVGPDGTRHPRDEACPSCTSGADGIGTLRQLHARHTTLAAVSIAPYEKIAAFRARRGYSFPWYSSAGSDFNYDFHATIDERIAPVQVHFKSVEELAGKFPREDLSGDWPGISVFLRLGEEVFHTYSTYGRGLEEFHNDNPYLDLTALGRQEAWEEPKGRAIPQGMQVGGPNMRVFDDGCSCRTPRAAAAQG